MWQTLAEAINVILKNKLKEPLRGDDMVLVIMAYHRMLANREPADREK